KHPETRRGLVWIHRTDYRRLVEVHRNFARAVAVHDGALRIGNDAAHDAAAHEQVCGLLDAHARDEVVGGKDRRGGTLHNQRATLAHELIQRLHAIEPQAAADVRRGVRGSERLEFAGLLVWQGAVADLGNAFHHGLHGAADVREDDHVVLAAQLTLAQLDVAEVGVRHAIGIQRRTHPTLILGALPTVHVADAWDVHVVGRHFRRRGHGPGRQAELLEFGLQRAAVRIADDDGAGAELVPARREVLFGRFHLRLRELEAERRDVVVG